MCPSEKSSSVREETMEKKDKTRKPHEPRPSGDGRIDRVNYTNHGQGAALCKQLNVARVVLNDGLG